LASGDVEMTSLEELIALIGQPMDSLAVRSFLQARALERSKYEDDYEPERYLTSRADGYAIQHKKGKRARVECIWIYLEPAEGYTPFVGPLPRGLRAELSQLEVRRLWGEPSRSGAADGEGEWLWDRFDSKAVCVHIAYGRGGVGIRRITLMAPNVAP
jgi:hypothetical protein